MGESRLFISGSLFSHSLLRETGFLLSSRLSDPSAPRVTAILPFDGTDGVPVLLGLEG